MADRYDRYEQARKAWEDSMQNFQRMLQAAERELESRHDQFPQVPSLAQGPQGPPPQVTPQQGAIPLDYDGVEEEWRKRDKRQKLPKGSPRHSSAPSEESQEEARQAALVAAREINQLDKGQGSPTRGEAGPGPRELLKSPPKNSETAESV